MHVNLFGGGLSSAVRRILGIDLGTTYSAMAAVEETGAPAIITNREGERTTPSVVLFQGGEPIIGTLALRSATVSPNDVVRFVKRQMGNPRLGVRHR